MNSKLIAVPLMVIAIALLYAVWEIDESYSWYLAIVILLLAVVYIMAPQIDWFFSKKQPPLLDEGARKFLLRHSRFFRELPIEGKKQFEQRISLWIESREWRAQNLDEVPEDVKVVIAAGAVETFWPHGDEYLLPDYEQSVLFMGPFPTPQHHAWHASESFAEDGVLLFSVDHLLRAFVEPHHFLRLDLYEMSGLLLQKHPEIRLPSVPDLKTALARVSGFPHDRVEAFLGLPITDLAPLAVAYFLQFPEKFRQELPELHRYLEGKAGHERGALRLTTV